jgi:hypothetical protein
MLYLIAGKEEINAAQPSETSPPSTEVQEDEIDKLLEQQDGWIKRNRDPRLYVVHIIC